MSTPPYEPPYAPPTYGPPQTPPTSGPPDTPPSYGPPAPGQAPPGPWAGTPETSSRAVVVLACAIGSFVVLPFVLAVVALVLAPGARREIEASGGRLTGAGLVRAARVIAWVHLALFALVVVGLVVLVAVVLQTSP